MLTIRLNILSREAWGAGVILCLMHEWILFFFFGKGYNTVSLTIGAYGNVFNIGGLNCL